MKKLHFGFYVIMMALFAMHVKAGNPLPVSLSCDFTVTSNPCVEQTVHITYTGGAPATANYVWNFDSAVILSGTGQGPYEVKWLHQGEKHLTLALQWESQSCTASRLVIVHPMPAMFHMTGGGSYPPGGDGVNVGLSGSQTGILYKLRRNALYTGIVMTGNGNSLDFGKQTEPGTYDCVAKIDGSDCIREMDGHVLVTIENNPPVIHYLCMVTYDTINGRNLLIWNKPNHPYMSHFNIYKEIYQNNVFEKIAEVPFNALSVYLDTTSDPRVKSDKYKLSVTDSSGTESEKSPFHKTVHLSINPGIYGFNLIWNHYEGFEFKTYRIHRKIGDGSWALIDSVASNVDAYTDFYTGSGLATYYIEVLRLEPCHPAKSGEYLSVVSNFSTSAPLGMEENELSGVMIYPNPVRDILRIKVPDSSVKSFRVSVWGPDGRKYMEDISQGSAAVLDVSALPSGLYFLKLFGENSVTVLKFIRN